MQTLFIDQLGDSIHLTSFPKRIVSLVPSQTELLYSFGLENQVLGITKFCVHPDHWRTNKTIVGGTKNFRFDLIDSLQPDLIIGNKEENYEEGILKLREKYPVWMSDIDDFQDSLDMIKKLGEITDRQHAATKLVKDINKEFSNLSIGIKARSKKVLYLIWRNPWMSAGQQTFINALLEKCSLHNVIEIDRYPLLSDEELQKLNPDLVFLSSEPYPFKDIHVKELQTYFPQAKIVLVDGEMFSWYGSRLLLVPRYLKSLFSAIKS